MLTVAFSRYVECLSRKFLHWNMIETRCLLSPCISIKLSPRLYCFGDRLVVMRGYVYHRFIMNNPNCHNLCYLLIPYPSQKHLLSRDRWHNSGCYWIISDHRLRRRGRNFQYSETERSSGWLSRSSLERLKLASSVPCGQGSSKCWNVVIPVKGSPC